MPDVSRDDSPPFRTTPRLTKDRADIIRKFAELVDQAEQLCKIYDRTHPELPGDSYWALRVSAINLLTRLTSRDSVYVQELVHMKCVNSFVIKGILEAARDDYLQGFMVDHKLLLSAEVFTDLLVQAEVLLEHDYKDAAAVIIRAVLEDGLRRLYTARNVETDRRDTIQQLNEKLYRNGTYTKLVHKEVIAKAEVGNCAAHGRFDEYSKQDVQVFLEFVQRFLAEHLR